MWLEDVDHDDAASGTGKSMVQFSKVGNHTGFTLPIFNGVCKVDDSAVCVMIAGTGDSNLV